MGRFENWLLGCEPNPPKNTPTMLPWGEEGWRDNPNHQFTVFLSSSNCVAHPQPAAGVPAKPPN